MASELVMSGLAGLIGGLARASVGLLKSLSKRKKFNPWYFSLTLILSAIIGLFLGIINMGDFRISLLAGYAGTDLLEGAYKLSVKSS
ncbi:hypothetical protein HY501_02445 [Candidatus Woesearchaeota archaeon]|nr:hypothetical protein [Candidatus Woesearchaeota archaeon]